MQHHDGIVVDVRTQRKWEIYSYARVQVKWFFAEITCRWLCLIKERLMHVTSKVTVNLYTVELKALLVCTCEVVTFSIECF